MADKAVRSWAAKCRFAGKKQFYLGTVVLPREAMQHEVDAALLKLWGEMMPHSPPDQMITVPGVVFFVPEEE